MRGMREQITAGFQVLSDGRTCWVNAPTGESVARFSAHGGIDVHRRLQEQRTKGECLDCRPGPLGLEGWVTFVASVKQHYQVEISDRHRPRGLK